jgi:fumarate reductase (CoM/CoB) subunit A
MSLEEISCEVLVIGGGAAGSRAAYEAKRRSPQARVVMVVEGRLGGSGSSVLVASESLGINAPFDFMGDGDSPEEYYRDMLGTGGGCADPGLCRVIADESCARLRELMDLGLRFDSVNGRPVQRLLSGCSRARSRTCGGSTGLEIVKILGEAGAALGVEVMERIRIVELVQDARGSVCGAFGYPDAGGEVLFRAASIVLATGGAGRLFRKNINPPGLEGDGWAMAYECGAELVNMEFFQVGPAVMREGIQFIIHSHMWRFRPLLTNARGEAFLSDYCPDGVEPSAVLDAKAMSYPFSVRTVAKYLDIAIFKEIMAGRGTERDAVFFDLRHAGEEKLREKAPISYGRLKAAGIDLATQRMELGLVVQNFNGGIRIDADGFSGVPGLYAAGEVSGGVHGSDRPGGNNLTDTQVFGYRAGRAAAEAAEAALEAKGKPAPSLSRAFPARESPDAGERELARKASDIFYREMTIVRTKAGLQRVLSFIRESSEGRLGKPLRNRLLVGELLASAMLAREESRGTHYREDFPATSISGDARISMRRGPDGRVLVRGGKGATP